MRCCGGSDPRPAADGRAAPLACAGRGPEKFKTGVGRSGMKILRGSVYFAAQLIEFVVSTMCQLIIDFHDVERKHQITILVMFVLFLVWFGMFWVHE